jgi:hypothetical protein
VPDKQCSCGSGKKAGGCCGKDNVVDFNRYRWWRAGQRLRKKLAEFADSETFLNEAAVARESFFSVMDPELADEEDDFMMERFFEWFIFDYRIQGRTLLEYYGMTKETSPEEIVLINKWIKARNSVHQVLRIENGNVIALKDLLTGSETAVCDRSAAREVEPGNILLMRVLPVGDDYEFSTGGLILPSFTEKYITSRIKLDAELYWSAHGGRGNWDAYLRDRAHVLNALILETGYIIWDLPINAHDADSLSSPEELSSKLAQKVTDIFLDYFYERWVNEPMDVLQGKTPLEASRTKSGRRKLQTLLSELQKVENSRKRKGEPFYDLSRLWRRLRLSSEPALAKTERGGGRVDAGYAKVEGLIRDGLQKMGYRPRQVKSAVEIWQRYCQMERPVFKKPEAWAASVIYTVARLLGDKTVNQNELAGTYNVSVSTISNNYRDICRFLHIDSAKGEMEVPEKESFLARILSNLKA